MRETVINADHFLCILSSHNQGPVVHGCIWAVHEAAEVRRQNVCCCVLAAAAVPLSSSSPHFTLFPSLLSPNSPPNSRNFLPYTNASSNSVCAAFQSADHSLPGHRDGLLESSLRCRNSFTRTCAHTHTHAIMANMQHLRKEVCLRFGAALHSFCLDFCRHQCFHRW